tara:strand:+ start:856 stop:2118 length:1263 start_codon:yes stop_codon:yes gene_type:complete
MKNEKSKNKKTKKLYGGDSSNYINYYLNNLQIDSKKTNIKDIIYNKSFPDGVRYFINAKKKIFNNQYITDLSNSSNKELSILQKKWVSCNNKCIQIIKQFIDHELSSTAFYLRALAESIISINKGFIHINISDENSDLITGKWENDYKLFNISFIGVDDKLNNNTSRLIMGFGPSASGKTFWTKSIIQLFSMTDTSFPKTFMTIDGGKYRELSQIYQFIIRSVKRKGHGGLTNLVSSGMLGSSLFDSNIIKKNIIKFLLDNKDKCPISLYVPETLGDCNMPFPKSCKDKIKNFISITNDSKNWIGLNIFQHKLANDCSFDDEFKCVGCTESGMTRQSNEGKEYNNISWGQSKKNGDREIKNAPGGGFTIHNSGGKKWTDLAGNSLFCKSVITEISLKSIFEENLIPEIEQKFNCMYFHKP